MSEIPNDGDTVTLSFRCGRTDAERIRTLAEDKGQSSARFIRDIVLRAVSGDGGADGCHPLVLSPETQTRMARLMSLLGILVELELNDADMDERFDRAKARARQLVAESQYAKDTEH